MGKEFMKAIEDAQNAKGRGMKLLIAGYIEDLAEDYPKDGYKYKRAMKAAAKIREEAKR